MKQKTQYQRIFEYISEQIATGTLLPGDQLPTEMQLCERFGVSRMTVNKALGELVHQHYIRRIPGKGSFVEDPEANVLKEVTNLGRSSFSSDIEGIHKKPGAILVDYRVIRAADAADAQKKLGLRDEELIHFICRIRTIDGVRTALSRTYIPIKFLPALDVNCLEHSLYQYLDQQYGIHPVAADYTFRAVMSDKHQQELLEIEPCALLVSCHVSGAEPGKRFEYTETYYVGSRYTYHFNLENKN
ncbi:GntR family transcriptional regulator [Oribacterium sp. FC2011]|uniref:GntR family transcriptional regulator n=1 Tax=Oribacterium sp. FC2011 TaxID=1408311 RepID=UPI0004E289BE|nr:GntR family transcriptional regulator [Oribacterium sp. FC2011]